MSYDIKLQNKCDHRIQWERVPLEVDSRTIRIPYLVSSGVSLSLRINNVKKDPTTYTIYTVTKSLSTLKENRILLNNKVKDYQPIVELNYLTTSDYCPKCLAVKTLDDWVYTSSGDVSMTQKEPLLLQQLEKIIVTVIGSNPFQTWYGTSLNNLIGTKTFDFEIVRAKISDQINIAIDRLKTIQKQLVNSRRKVDPGELFGQVLSLSVEKQEDPTFVLVDLVFTSQSGKTLEYSQFIELSIPRTRIANK